VKARSPPAASRGREAGKDRGHTGFRETKWPEKNRAKKDVKKSSSETHGQPEKTERRAEKDWSQRVQTREQP